MTRCVALIPARYGSTRLPGKPLLKKTGKYLIRHVVESVSEAGRIAEVIVCTDDERILKAVEEFGGRAAMTSRDHQSGSDRIAEVAAGLEADFILNVQGDEPGIDPLLLDRLVAGLESRPDFPIITAGVPIRELAVFEDPNAVKVVACSECDEGRTGSCGSGSAGATRDTAGSGSVKSIFDDPGAVHRALYFSRAPVPHGADPGGANPPLKHIGVYAFRREALDAFTALPVSELEKTERLEQLRALEHDMKMGLILTDRDAEGIDTPDDYEAFVASCKRAGGRAGESK